MTLEEKLELLTLFILDGEQLSITLENGRWRIQTGEPWAHGYTITETVDVFMRAKIEQLKYRAQDPQP